MTAEVTTPNGATVRVLSVRIGESILAPAPGVIVSARPHPTDPNTVQVTLEVGAPQAR